MKREWQPGDVAMISGRGGTELAICFQGGRVNGAARWTTSSGVDRWSSVSDARPLVVIDPEDEVAAERLVTLFLNQFPAVRKPEDDEAMQAALREFAAPTPPSCSAVLHIGIERVQCERDDHDATRDHRNDSIGQGVRWSA